MSCFLSLFYIVVSLFCRSSRTSLSFSLRENDKVKPRASLKVMGSMALEDTSLTAGNGVRVAEDRTQDKKLAISSQPPPKSCLSASCLAGAVATGMSVLPLESAFPATVFGSRCCRPPLWGWLLLFPAVTSVKRKAAMWAVTFWEFLLVSWENSTCSFLQTPHDLWSQQHYINPRHGNFWVFFF